MFKTYIKTQIGDVSWQGSRDIKLMRLSNQIDLVVVNQVGFVSRLAIRRVEKVYGKRNFWKIMDIL